MEVINWLSPLREDAYAEYRDENFINLLGIELSTRPLDRFWARGGPQWDALARTDRGNIVLVEAKANLAELVSPASQASEKSLSVIRESLNEVQRFLGVDTEIDWTGRLYQYTNRIAHLYLLRELNNIPAYLVFVYFIGDKDVQGPTSVAEWKAAVGVAKNVLGIGSRHPLSKYIADVYLDVGMLATAV